MISGFGGSGKSSLSVLLGITGAHHLKSFMGRDVPYPFSTLIMNQEDTMDQLRLKASAYQKHFKLRILYRLYQRKDIIKVNRSIDKKRRGIK